MTARDVQLRTVLDKLEAAYGPLVAAADPVEAGVLVLLAQHAPQLATAASRDRLRDAFTDWNEARVADPWDVTTALEAVGDPAARNFARAMLRWLETLHATLNRCSFEVPAGEARPDFPALLEKMRATPPVKAVVLALLDTETGGWCVTPEIQKVALKLGLVGKTTSAAKVAAGLAEICTPDDRLRLHYLLARYGAREKDDADPLDEAKAAKSEKAAKPAKAEKAPKVEKAEKTEKADKVEKADKADKAEKAPSAPKAAKPPKSEGPAKGEKAPKADKAAKPAKAAKGPAAEG